MGTLDYCPKCGKLLQTKKNDDGHTILICMKCGFKRSLEENEKVTFTEKINHDHMKELTVVMNEQQADTTKPAKDLYCPNCKKVQKVSFWMLQTRSADESPTRFFRCTVCGETWREYD